MRSTRTPAAAALLVLLVPWTAGARPPSGASWGVDVGAPATFERHTAPGEPVRVATYARWNDRCESSGDATVELLTPPAHGRMEVRHGTRTIRNGPRFGTMDCTGHVLPSVDVFYVPAPGFTGTDRFDYKLTSGNHVAHDTAILTVQ